MINDKIKTIVFSRLRNEEHFGFHTKVAKLVNEYNLSETVEALVTSYNERYDVLNDSLEIIRRSVHTAQLVDADIKRCTTFRGLRAAVTGHLRHFETAKSLAATRVGNILRHYRGMLRKSRNERTAMLMNMLQDLRDETAADLQTLDINSWVSELEAENRAYQNLEAQRISKRGIQLAKNVHVARLAADAAYRSLIKGIEVHGTLHPDDANYATLVFELNASIETVMWPIAQRRGVIAASKKKDLETTSSSSSSPQLVELAAG
ncbi:MAG: DUF6261 family protein [Puniceicoccales bacterium]|jgi:hypothetical protein|nr:DUF6261 family protein [Puniceicoccales bacterium]